MGLGGRPPLTRRQPHLKQTSGRGALNAETSISQGIISRARLSMNNFRNLYELVPA